MVIKKKTQLIIFCNQAWALLGDHVAEMGDFLGQGINTPQISELIVISVRLILSELLLNPKTYKKYLVREYSDEDLVDIVIEAMTSQIPPINDYQANVDYIEKIRDFIWGHIKKYEKKLTQILSVILENLKNSGNASLTSNNIAITSDEMTIFVDCLTVVWVECVLRQRELVLMEHHITS